MNARQPVDESKAFLGGRRRGHGFVQRLASTRAFLRYTEEDEALVNASRDIVMANADAIVGEVYVYLLSHRETAVHFTQADGRTDRGAVDARHGSLKKWLAMAIEAPLDERLSSYLAEVGRSHTGRDRGAGARVKGRYMLATMSFLQAELIMVLEGAIVDRPALVATIAAWSKLLMIHLDLFLAVYASSEGTAHWY